MAEEADRDLTHPGPRRPLIGITGNYADDRLQLLPGYFRAIEAAGGVALVIPPTDRPDGRLHDLLDRIDGLLLSGGADVNPLYVDEEPSPALHSICPERDATELLLARLAHRRSLPMLGICRGIQVMAAALGGHVDQDMATARPEAALLKHSQDAPRHVATHSVATAKGSLLESLFGPRLAVNSFHHQAVGEAGPLFRVTATAPDGTIEAIESTAHKWEVGVQWHPECFCTAGDTTMQPLFSALVDAARRYGSARRFHEAHVSLDSHCDTPMVFSPELDLTRRSDVALVDFVKMREGLLDAVIMVAYLPQGPCDEAAYTRVRQTTASLLSEIEQRVAAAPGIALAASPADIRRHKQAGLRSVMRGIENGYAIGRDLSLLEQHRRHGVVYMTLCHNGDNDICDSARHSQTTHGGLSAFGRQVVGEMNRVGLMVDLSHAAPSSFYDALEASATPIVCSHSCCRALCDHPRNLTDDQLRALAQAGGVAQMTFYHGFLVSDNEGREATIDDATAHLLHAISVAGIDHVGIGSDFDGDGGVSGLASAADLRCLTERLQAEGLTDDDLAKIWGGNFMRVMQHCQDAARL